MERDAARVLIESALADLLKDPKAVAHLKRGRVENSFVSTLAFKLKPLFESDSISVDPHYNRHYNARKRLNDKNIELDIAIHEQGNDKNNLVAIEVETINEPRRDDIWKLEGLTRPLGGYGYKLGLFLVFGIGEKAGELLAKDWYIDGELAK